MIAKFWMKVLYQISNIKDFGTRGLSKKKHVRQQICGLYLLDFTSLIYASGLYIFFKSVNIKALFPGFNSQCRHLSAL